MTANSRKRLAMNSFRTAIIAGCALLTTNAFGQGADDRASARTDTTRATTEGRFQRLDQNRQSGSEEIVIQEEVRKPATKPSSVRSERKPPVLNSLIAEPEAKLTAAERARPAAKPVIVRRTVTVKRAAPLKINPY